MEEKVWIYLSKTGTGFQLAGADIISGFDAFVNADGGVKNAVIDILYV